MIALTATAVAQSVTVESITKRALHYNKAEQIWKVVLTDKEPRTITWTPTSATITCPTEVTHHLTFIDAYAEDGWNYTKNIFVGYDQDGELVELTHLFYYDNGVLPGTAPDGYAILLQYMNRGLKVMYTIYD